MNIRQIASSTMERYRRWAMPLLIGILALGVVIWAGHNMSWNSTSVSAAQTSNRQLTYRRIELTGTNLTQRGQGSAIVKSVTRNVRPVETFTVHVFNLLPNQTVQLLVNGRRLETAQTDGRGQFEVEFVRGQQLGPGQRQLPLFVPPVTQFDTVEFLTADGRELFLSGSYNLVQSNLALITTVRILNAAGQVALEGTFSTSSQSGATRQAILRATQADPNAKGQATIKLTDLTVGGLDQHFELSVDDLDVNPPFTLELNGGHVTSFTTNASGRAEIAYEGRYEAQAGQTEASSAIADSQQRILEARQAIEVANSFGANTSSARALLDDANRHLDDAQHAMSIGSFDDSVDSALKADDTARDATQQAVEAAAQAEQDNNGNGNGNGNDNCNCNDNDNSNDNHNDNDNGNDNHNDNDNGNDNHNDNDNGNDNHNGNNNHNDND
ncbi:MAG: hypothetical protein HY314_05930 [Acidobacteria bacterium]|nr:hypothetical protein [Acidobacteriota bacterium]